MGLNISTATRAKGIVQFSAGLAVIAVTIIALVWYAVAASANPPGPATDESFFTFDAGTGTITDYDAVNGPKDIVIPNQIAGEDVLAIAPATYDAGSETYSGAFADKGITSIYIGDTVLSVGANAFASNPITSVIIGTSSYSGTPQLVISEGNFNGVNSETVPFEPPIYDYKITNLSLGSVVKEITGSFNGSVSQASLQLPSGIESINGSFNASLIESLSIDNSSTDINASFNDNKKLQVIDIEAVGAIEDGFRGLLDIKTITIGEIRGTLRGIADDPYIDTSYSDTQGDLEITIGKVEGDIDSYSLAGFPNIVKLTINEVTGSILSASIAGDSDQTIADTSSALSIEIGKVGGGISSSSIYNFPQLTSLKIGEVVGSISNSSIYNNDSWTLADIADSLEIEIGKVGVDIESSIYGFANLTKLTVDEVAGSIDSSIHGSGNWTSADTVDSLVIEIGAVGGNIENSTIRHLPNLISLVINEVAGDIDSSIFGVSLTIADTASSLEVIIGTVGGDIAGSLHGLANLTRVTIDNVGNVSGSFYGDWGWVPGDTADELSISINNINGNLMYSLYSLIHLTQLNIGTVDGGIDGSIYTLTGLTELNIGKVAGDIKYGSIYELALLESVTIGEVGGGIHSGVFMDMPLLKTVTFGREDNTSAPAIYIGSGVFMGTDALEVLNLYTTISSIEDGTFADKNIKEITVGGNIPITEAIFGGNNANTGEYIRVYTVNPSNPANFQDTYIADVSDIGNPTLAYIVNPAVLTVSFIDSDGNELAPSVTQISSIEGVDNYTMASNPVSDTVTYQEAYSAYYRVGQTVGFPVPTIPGYSSPETVDVVIGSAENNQVNFVYTAITPGAPNTGMVLEALKSSWHVIILVALAALAAGAIGFRNKQKS